MDTYHSQRPVSQTKTGDVYRMAFDLGYAHCACGRGLDDREDVEHHIEKLIRDYHLVGQTYIEGLHPLILYFFSLGYHNCTHDMQMRAFEGSRVQEEMS